MRTLRKLSNSRILWMIISLLASLVIWIYVTSGETESFEGSLLEYPQYTRPEIYEGLRVPEILLSGDHAKIESWKKSEARRLTGERRPDLAI